MWFLVEKYQETVNTEIERKKLKSHLGKSILIVRKNKLAEKDEQSNVSDR